MKKAFGIRWFWNSLILGMLVFPVCYLFPEAAVNREIDLALAAIKLPGPGELEKIYNKPTEISIGVKKDAGDDGSPWIRMEADLHVATDATIEQLRRVITDYDNYPRYFKRDKSAWAFYEDGKTYLDVDVSFEILTFSYEGSYRVLMEELVHTEGEYILLFTPVKTAGSIKDVRGFWYLEETSLRGKPVTYMRYIAISRIVPKFAIQRLIMAMFVRQEHYDMFNEVLKAAARISP